MSFDIEKALRESEEINTNRSPVKMAGSGLDPNAMNERGIRELGGENEDEGKWNIFTENVAQSSKNLAGSIAGTFGATQFQSDMVASTEANLDYDRKKFLGDGIGGMLDYTVASLGQATPYLGTMVAGAAVASTIGAPAVVGSFASSFISMQGGNRRSLREMNPEASLAEVDTMATILTIGQSAIEQIGGMEALIGKGLAGKTSSGLMKKFAIRAEKEGLLAGAGKWILSSKNPATAFLKGAVEEVAEESAQGLMEVSTGILWAGKSYTEDELYDQLIYQPMMAFAPGGLMGGGLHLANAKGKDAKSTPKITEELEKKKFTDSKTGEIDEKGLAKDNASFDALEANLREGFGGAGAKSATSMIKSMAYMFSHTIEGSKPADFISDFQTMFLDDQMTEDDINQLELIRDDNTLTREEQGVAIMEFLGGKFGEDSNVYGKVKSVSERVEATLIADETNIIIERFTKFAPALPEKKAKEWRSHIGQIVDEEQGVGVDGLPEAMSWDDIRNTFTKDDVLRLFVENPEIKIGSETYVVSVDETGITFADAKNSYGEFGAKLAEYSKAMSELRGEHNINATTELLAYEKMLHGMVEQKSNVETIISQYENAKDIPTVLTEQAEVVKQARIQNEEQGTEETKSAYDAAVLEMRNMNARRDSSVNEVSAAKMEVKTSYRRVEDAMKVAEQTGSAEDIQVVIDELAMSEQARQNQEDLTGRPVDTAYIPIAEDKLQKLIDNANEIQSVDEQTRAANEIKKATNTNVDPKIARIKRNTQKATKAVDSLAKKFRESGDVEDGKKLSDALDAADVQIEAEMSITGEDVSFTYGEDAEQSLKDIPEVDRTTSAQRKKLRAKANRAIDVSKESSKTLTTARKVAKSERTLDSFEALADALESDMNAKADEKTALVQATREGYATELTLNEIRSFFEMVQKYAEPKVSKQIIQRRRLIDGSQAVDRKLSIFREENKVKRPRKDDPLYEEIMAAVPKRFLTNEETASAWDQILADALIDIPYIVNKDNVTEPSVLAEIYSKPMKRNRDVEAEEMLRIEEDVAAYMAEEIANGYMPDEETRNEFPMQFKAVTEGVDQTDLKPPRVQENVEGIYDEDPDIFFEKVDAEVRTESTQGVIPTSELTVNGMYISSQRTAVFFKSADVATVVHEFAHHARSILTLEQQQELLKVFDPSGDTKSWSIDSDEWFAMSMTKWIIDKKPPFGKDSKVVRASWEMARRIINTSYKSFDLNEETKSGLDELFGEVEIEDIFGAAEAMESMVNQDPPTVSQVSDQNAGRSGSRYDNHEDTVIDFENNEDVLLFESVDRSFHFDQQAINPDSNAVLSKKERLKIQRTLHAILKDHSAVQSLASEMFGSYFTTFDALTDDDLMMLLSVADTQAVIKDDRITVDALAKGRRILEVIKASTVKVTDMKVLETDSKVVEYFKLAANWVKQKGAQAIYFVSSMETLTSIMDNMSSSGIFNNMFNKPLDAARSRGVQISNSFQEFIVEQSAKYGHPNMEAFQTKKMFLNGEQFLQGEVASMATISNMTEAQQHIFLTANFSDDMDAGRDLLVAAGKYAKSNKEMGDFVDIMHKTYTHIYPMLAKEYKNVTGKEMNKVSWYMPFLREGGMTDLDSQLSLLNGVDEKSRQGYKDAEKNMKTRKGGSKKIKISDPYGSMTRYVNSASNYIAKAGEVKKLLALLDTQDVKDSFKWKFGNGNGGIMNHERVRGYFIKSVQGELFIDGRITPMSESESLVRKARTDYTFFALAAAVAVSVKQNVSLPIGLARSGNITETTFRAAGQILTQGAHVMKNALYNSYVFIGNKNKSMDYRHVLDGTEVYDLWQQLAPKLAERHGNPETGEAHMKSGKGIAGIMWGGRELGEVLMSGITTVDALTVGTLWKSSFDTWLRKNKSNGMTETEAMLDAAEKASRMISSTQPASVIHERSLLFRENEWVKSVFMFTGATSLNFETFVVDVAGRSANAVNELIAKNPKGALDIMIKGNGDLQAGVIPTVAVGFIIPAIMFGLISRRREPTKEEAVLDVLAYPFAMLPFSRAIIGAAVGQPQMFGEGSTYYLAAAKEFTDGIEGMFKMTYNREFDSKSMNDLSSALALMTKSPRTVVDLGNKAIQNQMGLISFGNELRRQYVDPKPKY